MASKRFPWKKWLKHFGGRFKRRKAKRALQRGDFEHKDQKTNANNQWSWD